MSALFGCQELALWRAERHRARRWRTARRLAGLAAWVVIGGSLSAYAAAWALLRWAA